MKVKRLAEPMVESFKYNLRRKLAEIKLDGLLDDVHMEAGNVYCSLALPADIADCMDNLQQQVEAIALAIPGVKKAYISFTMAKKAAPAMPQLKKSQPAAPALKKPEIKPFARNIIAIASGKGGVGKSTSAINIARSLIKKGLRIGLLDLDIYGPSIPKLANIEGQKPEASEDSEGVKKILPIISEGLQIMSIGFFIAAGDPVIWRGHMATSFVRQMLNGVAWSGLDVLIIDMPPGTGDIQLTLVQHANVTGAIIVSTPEELALLDVRRAIAMFRKTNVPILGLIENMSCFIAPDTGKIYHIFGENGAADEAKKQGLQLLGQIPFELSLNTSHNWEAGGLDGLYNSIAEQLMPQLGGISID